MEIMGVMVITHPMGLAESIVAVIQFIDEVIMVVIQPMEGIMAEVVMVVIEEVGAGMAEDLEMAFTVVVIDNNSQHYQYVSTPSV
jgi:hypothetical protein